MLTKEQAALQYADIQRRQQMADALSQQSQSQPKNLMTYGPLQAIGQVITGIMANKKRDAANADATAFVDKQAADQKTEMARILQASAGTPATPEVPFKDEAGAAFADTKDIPGFQAQPAGLVAQPAQPAVPGGQKAMVAAMLASPSSDYQKMAMQIMAKDKQDSWKLGKVGAPGNREQSIFYNPSDPSQFKPVGQAIAKTDGTTVNVGNDQADPLAPWRNINDSKKRDEAKIRYGTQADKTINEMRDEAQKASEFNQTLNRFTELNKTNSTGGVLGVPLLGAAVGAARGLADPGFKEMQSISDKMTPQMRNGMPGAASDRDVAMFRGATVSVDKPQAANDNIARGLATANQNKIDRASFFSDYMAAKGHINGADREWKKYLEANPIFDLKAPEGSYQLNPNRVSYQQFMGGQQPQQPQQQQIKAGTVDGGFVFVGGDPSNPNSWKKQ